VNSRPFSSPRLSSTRYRLRDFTFYLALALLAALCTGISTAGALEPKADPYIVVLNDDVAHPANVAQRHEENRGAEIGHIYRSAIRGYSAELTPGELKAIKQDPNVDYVERDGTLKLDSQVQSTGFKRVFAPGNPNLAINEIDDVRTDADIAIIDDGVAPHPDLNVVSRTDCAAAGQSGCITETTPTQGYHATHVAGIAAALDNNFGVVGTAPGARIWSVKVFDTSGGMSLSNLIAGINWVTAHSSQIEVANVSLHCPGCAPAALREAIAASVNKGVVYVAAAGNEGKDVEAAPQNIPATFPDVITVSNLSDSDGAPGGSGGAPSCANHTTYLDDYLANNSNWGAAVDIAAPGVCILSTVPGGGYAVESGTSMATPMVAGAVAGLAAAKNPNNRAEVEAIRSYVRALGNYNWTDARLIVTSSGSYVEPIPDGIREPLLDMSIPPPTVTTNEPTEISQARAKLNGSVNPNGIATTYYIEWGMTTSYGNTVSGSAGSGTGSVAVSKVVETLAPGITYHYRVRAESAGGSVQGVDRQFTTPRQATVFFSDASHTNTMTRWGLDSGAGWLQTPMAGDAIAAGSKPATLMINGAAHVFFVDANKSNTISEWVLDPATGLWKQNSFFGDSVAAGTSPSAVMFNGAVHVFFVDANKSNTISDWVLDPATNLWKQNFLWGDPVAAKSSPSAVVDNGTLHVAFVDAATGNTISDWGLSSSWGQNRFYGDPVMAGSSPSAISNGGLQVYFADAAKSNTLAFWGWNSSGIGQTFLWTDPLTAASSPSVIMNGPTVHAYFSDAAKSNTLSVWKWNSSGLEQIPFFGDPLTAGSSPSAVLNGTTEQIYFSDAAKSNTVSVWTWNATSTYQTFLFGGSVAAGSSPSGMVIG